MATDKNKLARLNSETGETIWSLCDKGTTERHVDDLLLQELSAITASDGGRASLED